MALVSEIVTELAAMSGASAQSVGVLARALREAGLISQRGRGRGAAHATPLDAARLCIALMVGGRHRDAAQVVRDFGQLELHAIEPEAGHPVDSLTLQAVGGLGEAHRFEDALAALIGLWSDERLVAAMDAQRGPDGFWPAMLARICTSTLTGTVILGVTRYSYLHRHLREAGHHRLDADGALGSDWPITRFLEVAARYTSGIRRTHEITGVEIMPLGEVVAGDRPAGHRETDAELTRQMHERMRRFREAGA